jgi:uncharacterized GH25 family protein
MAGMGEPVCAHDLKVFASRQEILEPGGKITVYLGWGHRVPVDEFTDAAAIERYELIAPDGAAKTLEKNGLSLQANAIAIGKPGVHEIVACRKPSIYTYVLDGEGERQLKRGPKVDHVGANIESAKRYRQCAKALIVVGERDSAAPQAVGLPLEIIPLDGPDKWTANADVRFQVLENGKPARSAEVQARSIGFKPDNAWCYATQADRDGEFTIRPAQDGVWIVKATVERLTQGATREQYDFESLTATLTLDVRP